MRRNTLLSLLCFLGVSGFAAADYQQIGDIRSLDTNNNGIYEEGEVDPNAAYQTGPCVYYCPVTRFREKKYCVKRYVQEPYTVQKKCCRMVKKYHTKRCCRYVPKYENVYYCKRICKKVPEYYDQTYCVEEPEYYCVPETKYRTRCVTEDKCCYEPYTCVEKRCVPCPPACPPVESCPTCPMGGCPSN